MVTASEPRDDRDGEVAAWMAQTSACTRCGGVLVRDPDLIGAWLSRDGSHPRGVCPARTGDGYAGGAPHVPGEAAGEDAATAAGEEGAR